MSRFIFKFAAGKKGGATSGVWRLWTAKNQPDLYLAINGLGGIKATVHCPRVDKPTWASFWGFTSDTKYEVAKLVRAAQPGKRKLSWTAARLSHYIGAIDPRVPLRDYNHLHVLEDGFIGIGHRQLLVVRVRLLAVDNYPAYEIVVGEKPLTNYYGPT